MLELTFLIILIVVLCAILYMVLPWKEDTMEEDNDVEGFATHYLQSCPAGFKSSYNANGDVVCCDGEVMANKCLGDKQCILNGKGAEETPNCVDLLKREYAEKSATWCPPSLPNYFEDRVKKTKGCTSGQLNATMSGPSNTNQPHCMIYSDLTKNRVAKDSCYNKKLLEDTPCFGKNCTKELIQPVNTAPPLVAIGFSDSMGIHRMAYTRDSAKNYWDAVNPQWKHQGMNLDKNIMIAEVAKAYYIDKTMSKDQVDF